MGSYLGRSKQDYMWDSLKIVFGSIWHKNMLTQKTIKKCEFQDQNFDALFKIRTVWLAFNPAKATTQFDEFGNAWEKE